MNTRLTAYNEKHGFNSQTYGLDQFELKELHDSNTRWARTDKYGSFYTNKFPNFSKDMNQKWTPQLEQYQYWVNRDFISKLLDVDHN